MTAWIVATSGDGEPTDWRSFGDAKVIDVDWYYITNRDGIAEMKDAGQDYVQECLDSVADAPQEVKEHVSALLRPYLSKDDR